MEKKSSESIWKWKTIRSSQWRQVCLNPSHSRSAWPMSLNQNIIYSPTLLCPSEPRLFVATRAGVCLGFSHTQTQTASDVWQVLSSSHVSSCVPDLLRSETPCLHGRFPWQTRCARALASWNKHIHFGYHWRKTFNAVRVYVDICGWGTGKFAHQSVYGRNVFLFQRPKHLHLPKTSGFWSLVTVAMEEVRWKVI